MRFLIKILFGLIFFILALNVSAQDDNLEIDSISDNILLKQELAGGLTIHNMGFGLLFRRGWNKTFFNSRMLELEVVSMKPPKQVRVINPYYWFASFGFNIFKFCNEIAKCY